MTAAELRELRKTWDLTQEEVAKRMALQRRAYIRLEMGDQLIRETHVLILERISIDLAVETGELSYIIPRVRYIIDNLISLAE